MAWICLNDAFVSIVEDGKKGFKVRARKKKHLERLFPGEPILTTKDSDYRHRVFVSREKAAQAIAERILTIDYDNFKNSVDDHGLHKLYAEFWRLHWNYQFGRDL